MDFYKGVTQLTLLVLVVLLGEKAVCGPSKRKKKSAIKAPIVYNNLPSGTAIL